MGKIKLLADEFDLEVEPEQKRLEPKKRDTEDSNKLIAQAMGQVANAIERQSAFMMLQDAKESIPADIGRMKIPKKWHCKVNRTQKGLIDSFVLTEITNNG